MSVLITFHHFLMRHLALIDPFGLALLLLFLLLTYFFLPVDFVSATLKATSIFFFQLSRYSLWLHLGGVSSDRSIRSIGSHGVLPNIR